MIDWEKAARAEMHPIRIRVLEAIDELADEARISPSEIAPRRRGHLMTEENTIYVRRNERPGRACLACRNERKDKSAEKMRARRAARRAAEAEKAAA